MQLTKQEVESRICAARVVAVLTLDAEADALPVADALIAGGIRAIELTLRTPEAVACLRRVAAERAELLVGAGTVLTAQQLRLAREAGAAFAVSPGLNHAVSGEADIIGLPYFPGVMTPTDIENALALGHRLLKFFPAEQAGGIKMLKALEAPYGQAGIRFLPLGGINVDNARQYLALPVVAAIGGSWIAERSLIKAGKFDEIRARAAEACRLAS